MVSGHEALQRRRHSSADTLAAAAVVCPYGSTAPNSVPQRTPRVGRQADEDHPARCWRRPNTFLPPNGSRSRPAVAWSWGWARRAGDIAWGSRERRRGWRGRRTWGTRCRRSPSDWCRRDSEPAPYRPTREHSLPHSTQQTTLSTGVNPAGDAENTSPQYFGWGTSTGISPPILLRTFNSALHPSGVA